MLRPRTLEVADKLRELKLFITQCINHNGFYKDEMVELLKKNKEYKKILPL